MLDVLTSRRPLSMENGARVTLDVTPQDLRALGFAERGRIPDSELDHLIDLDIPGALTEQALRATLKKTGIKREATRPACVKP